MTARAIVPEARLQFEGKAVRYCSSTLPPPTARPHGQSLQGELTLIPSQDPNSADFRRRVGRAAGRVDKEQLPTIDAEDWPRR